jgi:hypothetical protein
MKVPHAKQCRHHGVPEEHDGVAEEENERASEDNGHEDMKRDVRGAMSWNGHGGVIVKVHHHKDS